MILLLWPRRRDVNKQLITSPARPRPVNACRSTSVMVYLPCFSLSVAVRKMHIAARSGTAGLPASHGVAHCPHQPPQPADFPSQLAGRASCPRACWTVSAPTTLWGQAGGAPGSVRVLLMHSPVHSPAPPAYDLRMADLDDEQLVVLAQE